MAEYYSSTNYLRDCPLEDDVITEVRQVDLPMFSSTYEVKLKRWGNQWFPWYGDFGDTIPSIGDVVTLHKPVRAIFSVSPLFSGNRAP